MVFEESRQKLRVEVSRSRTKAEDSSREGSEGPALVLCKAQPILVLECEWCPRKCMIET